MNVKNLEQTKKEANILNKSINKINHGTCSINLKEGRKRSKQEERTDGKTIKQITRWKFKPNHIGRHV